MPSDYVHDFLPAASLAVAILHLGLDFFRGSRKVAHGAPVLATPEVGTPPGMTIVEPSILGRTAVPDFVKGGEHEQDGASADLCNETNEESHIEQHHVGSGHNIRQIIVNGHAYFGGQ